MHYPHDPTPPAGVLPAIVGALSLALAVVLVIGGGIGLYYFFGISGPLGVLLAAVVTILPLFVAFAFHQVFGLYFLLAHVLQWPWYWAALITLLAFLQAAHVAWLKWPIFSRLMSR